MKSIRRQRIGGFLLLGAVALALLLANSPLSNVYFAVADVELIKVVALFLFFLNIGLELRHELRGGILGSLRSAATPLITAIFGMATPVLIYLIASIGTANQHGWPAVMSTDVAFALAVLAIAGRWLPAQARAFILAVAVIDDSLAILVLAVVFAASFHPTALVSLAAVLVGLFVPGLHRIRPQLEPAVNLVALPLFGFLSAGVAFAAVEPIDWRLVIAIVLAIVIGKPIGIYLGACFAIRSKLGTLDSIITKKLLRTISIVFALCFTVSLMMVSLAFSESAVAASTATISVVAATFIMVVAGSIILRRAGARAQA